MTKGTPSMGKRNQQTHMRCRRCGRHTYHFTKKVCAACGFGRTAKVRAYNWQWKTIQRDRRF
ncbi:MAG: 50S ribosomal protein L37e [Candidatus Aenigmarchaeota archaeon]|nr:50S ribosomal protein L37e [Candidatus Aenigmarchaeota archaeon]